MPQFDQIGDIYASQLLWLLIFFGAIFVVVGMGMLPRIQATVDRRDDQIAADLKAAGEARARADRLEEDYRAGLDKSRAEAARLAAEAKVAAAKATEARVAEADAQISSTLDAAMARIGAARQAALGEIEGIATEAAQAMVDRVAGFAVDAEAARSAVKQELVDG